MRESAPHHPMNTARTLLAKMMMETKRDTSVLTLVAINRTLETLAFVSIKEMRT
jgi:hypothetical protein